MHSGRSRPGFSRIRWGLPRGCGIPARDSGVPELAAAILALGGFALTIASRADFDLWWHLAVGRFVALHHKLPVPDEFSFTAAGRYWIAHEWLAQLMLYGVHLRFGMLGLLVTCGTLTAATVLIALRTMRRSGAGLAAFIWCFALLFALQPFLGPRPHVAAFLFMAILVDRLEAWIANRGWTIWLLPALFGLWANVHGSFVVGLAVPALLFTADTIAARIGWRQATRMDGSQRRELAWVLAASVVAAALNPNGFALLAYPLTKLNNPVLRHIDEWKAVDVTDPRTWGFVALAGSSIAVMAVRRPLLDIAGLVTAASFVAAGFWSLRFVPFAVLALGPVSARMFVQRSRSGMAPLFSARPSAAPNGHANHSSNAPAFRRVLNLGLFAIAAIALFVSVEPYDPATDPRLPKRAVDVLGTYGLRGPLFHPYEWGGYLIWRLTPDVPVFIDGRGDDLYTAGRELAQYADAVENLSHVDALMDDYRIGMILFEKDTPFVRYLLAGRQWRVTYEENGVVRLERASTLPPPNAPAPLLGGNASNRHPHPPYRALRSPWHVEPVYSP
jgi:hypothetical protein